ncbi:MAG TPA: LarC family nickel insertion protein [Chloroflexi bacterium]|nr:LarC family nickel insertion protein [Chloroflexota bacterium]
MTRIAYFDCFSGASGDMLLGAWLDAGVDIDALRTALALLKLPDYEVTLVKQVRHGISGSKFDVLDQGHDRPARNLHAVRYIVEESDLPEPVIEASMRVFTRLAEAEAQVHGTTVDEVHFHEVGAIDALVDIVGFCWAAHHLDIEEVYASALPVGSGTVRTEHGLLPVPAPATLNLLASAGAPILAGEARGELVTPTGAAILTTLARFSRPSMTVHQVGYGFGTKEFAWPNMVRVWIGETLEEQGPADRWRAAEHDHAHDHPHDHEGGHTHAHPHDDDDHDHHHHHYHEPDEQDHTHEH